MSIENENVTLSQAGYMGRGIPEDLVDHLPGAICLYYYHDKKLEPVVISDRYSEILGINASKIQEFDFQHIHPDDRLYIKQKAQEALNDTFHMDETYRSYNEKKQAYIWINIQANILPGEGGSKYAYVLYTDITRDKEIEQKLRANEQVLEAATSNAGVWYWNCHWRQNVAYMGTRFQQDFHLPGEIHDFNNQIMEYGIIDRQYHPMFREMCKRITQGEKDAECVVRGRIADGTAHWIRFKLTNIFDEEQVAQEAIGIMQLVDDVIEMERKYEIEKRRATEDENLVAYGYINVSNWEVMEYFGFHTETIRNQKLSPDELGQLIASEARGEKNKDRIRELHNRTYLLNAFEEGHTEYSCEYQRILPDGNCLWVNSVFHLMSDPNGPELLLFEYCYDINMKKTLNILMDFAVNDDYDLMGFINMQNQKTIMIYGKSSYNPLHENIMEDDYTASMLNFAQHAVVLEDRKEYQKMADLAYVEQCLQEQPSLEFYFRMYSNQGEVVFKKVRYLRYLQDNNSIIFIQSDITQLRLEQQRNQQKLEVALMNAKVANQAKTSFLSQMSHEIRTPMNAIIGMTKLAQQTDDRDEITKYLGQIDASSQYLLGIINDILDMSRIESGKLELHPQWIDGCKIIMDCVQMLKPSMEKKHLQFIYPKFIQNSRLRFYLDPLRVQQIYMNLLNNAVKFTPEGGIIELTVTNQWHDEHQGIDRIMIRDNGCGMSQEFMTRIFHPFEMEENEFSSRVQGTGLGLALVKAFVTQMGGRIWVESEPHKGSAFYFEIPYQAKIIDSEEEATDMGAAVSLQNCRILLVDDHPLNREIARKLLEHEHATVVTAEDGQDACSKFADSKQGYYDAILMDIRMPNMDGLEATRCIRGMEHPDAGTIPIIAMTANAFDEDARMSIEAGMNAHLAKPIEPEILMDTLSRYIENRNE